MLNPLVQAETEQAIQTRHETLTQQEEVEIQIESYTQRIRLTIVPDSTRAKVKIRKESYFQK